MTVASGGAVSLFGLDPATYRPHGLHAGDRVYPETNCYSDVIIELLHGRGDEPLAAMGTTVRLDFEGDQWTFFKPDPADLERLFGIDIHEMQPYRPIPTEIAELLAQGRTMTVELDAWYLPDTAATSYRTEHVKTTVIPEAIDLADGRLHYFHNGSLYALDGADYRGIFRIGSDDPTVLPPYTELVRFDSGLASRERRFETGARTAPLPPRPRASGQPVQALRGAPGRRPADAAGGRRRRLPRLRVRDRPDGRCRVRAVRRACRLGARRCRRHGVGGDGRDRRGLQGARLQARSPPPVRPVGGHRLHGRGLGPRLAELDEVVR